MRLDVPPADRLLPRGRVERGRRLAQVWVRLRRLGVRRLVLGARPAAEAHLVLRFRWFLLPGRRMRPVVRVAPATGELQAGRVSGRPGADAGRQARSPPSRSAHLCTLARRKQGQERQSAQEGCEAHRQAVATVVANYLNNRDSHPNIARAAAMAGRRRLRLTLAELKPQESFCLEDGRFLKDELEINVRARAIRPRPAAAHGGSRRKPASGSGTGDPASCVLARAGAQRPRRRLPRACAAR